MQGKAGKIGKKIIEELFRIVKDLGELSYDIITTPYGKLRIGSIPRSTYYNSLKRLESRGLVKRTKRNRKIYYSLTPEGKKYKLPVRLARKRRNDGFSTLVIFDIPETMKRERGILRRYLLKNGFILLQKSALISPDNISPELKELMEELGIRKFVSIISAKIHY
ncbi:MAG: helix-turn-helix domain-containing protein [bacterium]|nr:helix-turn-helix domain-containing protein [bacterium]